MNSLPMKSNNNPNDDVISSFFVFIFFSASSRIFFYHKCLWGLLIRRSYFYENLCSEKFYANKRKLFRISKKVCIKLFENDFLWSECQLFWLHNPKCNFSFYTHNRDLASPKWNFSGIKFREFENISIFVPERLTSHSCSIII